MSLERALPRFVAAGLVVAALLAIVMALTAPVNHRPELWRGPPDEYGHRASARYYMDHWLPPRVGDPATLDAYSRDYGLSNVNDTDPVYLFAGKFAALASPFAGSDRAVRVFNALLLAVLAAICLARPASWPAFAPLLFSPQVWYIFGYFNNDGFALFLAALAAWQAADRASAFNRFLDEPGWRRRWFAGLAFAVLVALLALSKRNYAVVLAFLPAIIALQRFGKANAILLGACAIAAGTWYLEWAARGVAAAVGPLPAAIGGGLSAVVILAAILGPRAARATRASVLARLLVVAAVAGAIVAARHAWDVHLHGSEEARRQAIEQVQERVAKPEYRPSALAKRDAGAYYGIELRARGTPLADLFAQPWAWHIRTLVTATGSYGWIEFTAPKAYYLSMLAAYCALLGVYAWATVRARDAALGVGFAIVAAFSAATAAAAIFHSWNNDFQAQGRYLFPVAAMLGAGLLLVRPHLPLRAFAAVAAACFALSLYSFVFIGLAYVPRSF